MGKYLAFGHGARTLLRSVRTPRPRGKHFPIRPSHLVNKYILYDPGTFKIDSQRTGQLVSKIGTGFPFSNLLVF